jgi:hypothetical protein
MPHLGAFHFLEPCPMFASAAKFCWAHLPGSHIFLVVAVAEFCCQQNFAAAATPCHTLAPKNFLELIYSLITMYKHNRNHGYTSRDQVHNTDLSIYGPQAGRLLYCDRDSGSGSSGRRFALRKDNDIVTDDALHLGCPIWHAPAELARDSGSMLLGASLL